MQWLAVDVCTTCALLRRVSLWIGMRVGLYGSLSGSKVALAILCAL